MLLLHTWYYVEFVKRGCSSFDYKDKEVLGKELIAYRLKNFQNVSLNRIKGILSDVPHYKSLKYVGSGSIFLNVYIRWTTSQIDRSDYSFKG